MCKVCPPGPRWKLVRIGKEGPEVGISGYYDIFDNFKALGLKPKEISKHMLIDNFSKFNYISPNSKDEYFRALKLEYERYLKSK
jgi:hypothetical protein